MLPEGCEPGEETVTATFELTVECRPPWGTEFSGSIGQGPTASGTLLDQDGDGVYTTSLPVERGTEQEVRIERLDPISDEPQAPLAASTIKDFGPVVFDEDKTLEASVSFCDDDSSDKGGSGGAKELPKSKTSPRPGSVAQASTINDPLLLQAG
jgi:hypothetical protein